MEIADNQHPIDLSRKCGYYESSSSYSKSIPASRPLPGLIPISVLGSPLTPEPRMGIADKKRGSGSGGGGGGGTSDDLSHRLNGLSPSSNAAGRSGFGFATNNDFQFKEQSKIRKELPRHRSVPHLSKNSTTKISRLKSISDSKISSIPATACATSSKATSIADTSTSFPAHRSLFLRNVPSFLEDNHANSTSSSRQRGKNHYYSSLASPPPSEKSFCWKPSSAADDDYASSLHMQSSKNTKQGPGVSLSTIQSLRKLLDKRKSMHRDN